MLRLGKSLVICLCCLCIFSTLSDVVFVADENHDTPLALSPTRTLASPPPAPALPKRPSSNSVILSGPLGKGDCCKIATILAIGDELLELALQGVDHGSLPTSAVHSPGGFPTTCLAQMQQQPCRRPSRRPCTRPPPLPQLLPGHPACLCHPQCLCSAPTPPQRANHL